MMFEEKEYVEISKVDYEKYKKVFGEFSLNSSLFLKKEVFEKKNIFPINLLDEIMIVPILFYFNYCTLLFAVKDKYYLIDDLYLFFNDMILHEESFMNHLRMSI